VRGPRQPAALIPRQYPTRRSASSPSCTRSNIACARRRISSRRTRRIRSPNATFCATFRCGNSDGFWKPHRPGAAPRALRGRTHLRSGCPRDNLPGLRVRHRIGAGLQSLLGGRDSRIGAVLAALHRLPRRSDIGGVHEGMHDEGHRPDPVGQQGALGPRTPKPTSPGTTTPPTRSNKPPTPTPAWRYPAGRAPPKSSAPPPPADTDWWSSPKPPTAATTSSPPAT